MAGCDRTTKGSLEGSAVLPNAGTAPGLGTRLVVETRMWIICQSPTMNIDILPTLPSSIRNV